MMKLNYIGGPRDGDVTTLEGDHISSNGILEIVVQEKPLIPNDIGRMPTMVELLKKHRYIVEYDRLIYDGEVD